MDEFRNPVALGDDDLGGEILWFGIVSVSYNDLASVDR